MKMESIQDLMTTGLTYVLDFEDQIAAAAPRIAQAVTNPELKEMFEKTETKSKEYGSRIEGVFGKLGKEVQRNTNHIAKAMVTEVEEMIKNTDAGPVRDAALIVAANQQQMYRVASYGCMKTYAELLGKQDAVAEMLKNLEDSKGGDEKLTKLAEEKINPSAKAA